MKGKKIDPQYVAICFRCGNPLKHQQIAGRFDGSLIDFETKDCIGAMFGPRPQILTFYFCSGCKEASKTYTAGGIELAVQKLEELARLNAADNQNAGQRELSGKSGDELL
jgi:hypothetical protein